MYTESFDWSLLRYNTLQNELDREVSKTVKSAIPKKYIYIILSIVAGFSPCNYSNYYYQDVKNEQNHMIPSIHTITVRPMILE